MRKTSLSCLLPLLAAAGLVSCSRETPPGPAPAAARRLTIAVIPKGTTHVFWKSVEAGAREAGEELGVEIRWKGPIKENDRAQQIQLVQQFVSEGVDAIVVAPLDDEALQAPCRDAMDAGIPVVVFDSALKGEAGRDYISFVATDNRKGGQLGGAELARRLGGEGGVVVMRYQVGSASTTKREEGCLAALAGQPGVRVLADNQYSGATVGEAINVAENILDTLKQARGVFTPNESSTVGMLTTLQRHNLAGTLKFVGFDSSDVLIEALKSGEIDALVVQNPRKMGYLGVKTAVARLRGQPCEELVDTGVALVTLDNLDTPEIQALVATK